MSSLRGCSKREKYFVYNTLACVPCILEGYNVLIDLRNETSVAGCIQSVDGYMNISLNNVVLIDQRGVKHLLENIQVQPRIIRQIHIPDSFHLKEEIKRFLGHVTEKSKPRTNPIQKCVRKRELKQ